MLCILKLPISSLALLIQEQQQQKKHVAYAIKVWRSMAHQGSVRHVSNEMPDYDAFISSLQLSLEQQSQQSSEQGPTSHTSSSFLSTSQCGRLQEAVRSWLLQGVQLVMKAWPPSSPQSPTSVRGQAGQDFSIYVGTGKVTSSQVKLVTVWERKRLQVLHLYVCMIVCVQCMTGSQYYSNRQNIDQPHVLHASKWLCAFKVCGSL